LDKFITAPTASECKTISWTGKKWILSLNSTTFYTSPDLITWTTVNYSHTVYTSNPKRIFPYLGHHLHSETNPLYMNYGSTTSEFTYVRTPINCYGQVSISAESNVTITNLPYTSATTYSAVAQTNTTVSTTDFTYGQAEIISGSSIKVYNTEDAHELLSGILLVIKTLINILFYFF